MTFKSKYNLGDKIAYTRENEPKYRSGRIVSVLMCYAYDMLVKGKIEILEKYLVENFKEKCFDYVVLSDIMGKER